LVDSPSWALLEQMIEASQPIEQVNVHVAHEIQVVLNDGRMIG
jgi:hypothetical protein